MQSTNGTAGHHAVQPLTDPREAVMRHYGEDWTGITDQKQRKKLQNRLNKRLSRQRQQRVAKTPCADATPTHYPACAHPGNEMSSRDVERVLPSFTHCTKHDIRQKREALEQFAEQALRSYKSGSPLADHHLRLMQLNIINAFTKNAQALGFPFDWLICEAVSPFGRYGPDPAAMTTTSVSAPPSLAPTKMQLKVKHHPWLDLLPLPLMRHNLLVAGAVLGAEVEERLHDELFKDLIWSGEERPEWTGLVVWGEPWNPQSWEMSESFAKKWAWLIYGCPEILSSTNSWRSKRGEKPMAMPWLIEEL